MGMAIIGLEIRGFLSPSWLYLKHEFSKHTVHYHFSMIIENRMIKKPFGMRFLQKFNISVYCFKGKTQEKFVPIGISVKWVQKLKL